MYLIAIAAALFPIVSGVLAFIAAHFIAAYRIAAAESAPFVPEYTASETAEWCADLSLSLDVDAEWIALADAPEDHNVEATTCDPLPLVSGCKLVSDRATFLASVRFGIAAAAARRTLREVLTLASDREWGEAYASAPLPVSECSDNAEAVHVESLGTLALLAYKRGDASEAAAAWHAESEAYLTALRECTSPVDASAAA